MKKLLAAIALIAISSHATAVSMGHDDAQLLAPQATVNFDFDALASNPAVKRTIAQIDANFMLASHDSTGNKAKIDIAIDKPRHLFQRSATDNIVTRDANNWSFLSLKVQQGQAQWINGTQYSQDIDPVIITAN